MRIDQLFPIAQDLAILMPDGEPSGIVLKVISLDGSAPRAVARAYAQSVVGKDSASIEEMEQHSYNVLAACVIGWSGVQDENGNELPFSQEKVRELFGKSELSFIREQVEAFVSKRAHFFRRSESKAS